MGQRRPTSGYSILQVLQGRTLAAIIADGTTLKISCDDCPGTRVWTPADATADPKLKPFLYQDIRRFADKLTCAKCGSRNFFVTIKFRDSW